MRKGATRLTSDLENRGAPRDSTYDSVAGDGGGSGNTLAWNLASERRVLGYCMHCLNVSCRPMNLSKQREPRKFCTKM